MPIFVITQDTIIIRMLLIIMLMGGCTPVDRHDGVHIATDIVSMDKAYVIGIKSELYQPSLYLSGNIQAVTTNTVTLPNDAYLKKRYISIGDRVKKGDVLASFDLPIIHSDVVADDTQDADNSNLTDDDHKNTKKTDSLNTDISTTKMPTTFRIIAPISGIITAHELHTQDRIIAQNTPIITISDDSELKLTSLLPKSHQEHLHIGDAVSFSTPDGQSFTGQVKKITPDIHQAHMLDVHILIKPDDIKSKKLTIGQIAGGRTDYGSLNVGVLVPASAVMDEHLAVIDLGELTLPPHKPTAPIHAYVWVINQDERLYLSPVEIISYIPKSHHLLVQGTVPLSGLIVDHPLSIDAKGKIVRLY